MLPARPYNSWALMYGPDPVGLGVTAAITQLPPIVEQRSPVNFFDINQVSSGVLYPFAPNQMNPTIFQQLVSGLNSTPDSLRFRFATTRLDVIDGWGDVTIPGGTFPVLREKRTTFTERRFDAKIPPLGWLDVTDVTIQTLNLNTLGIDTTVAHYFFNDVSKEPIAILTLDNSQSQVVSAQYRQAVSVPNPMVVSIDDGDADNIVSVGTLLTYTITFNKDIDATTVTAADFDNAGTATISIGTIMETAPGVFTVQVTPTTAGTLILRIPIGAVIADLNGNNLVVPVLDETTLTVLSTPIPIIGDANPANPAISDILTTFLMETQDPPEIFDPCTCRNNTGIIPNGTSTDNGLFDDEIIVISPTAGDTWEVSLGSIFPFPTNANPSAQPEDLTRIAPGTPLVFIGSVTTMDGIRYIYRLQIIHKDNEGYSVSVRETSNPAYAAIIFPISNRCYYPTPAISGLDATYCVADPAVVLMGTVDRGDGQLAATPKSAVFSINNNPVTQFNPQALGAGTFTVVYTVTAAAEGETIPGCMQAVSQQVQVNSTIVVNPLMSKAICSTKKIALADVFKGVVYVGNPADLRYTWTIKETDGLNGVLEGLQETDPTIGSYTPGKDAVSRGFVTLVLTVNNPDDACASTSAEVRISIAKIDCGDFPWNGN
ncbi:MAG TPA: hypothetical protein PKD70_08280 [Saprospiraceae bacterium]|nr:hypothetical protein [Saprospiraceae bacterium]